MDKRKFFDQLHNDLGKKYDFPPEHIQVIRSIAGTGKDRLEIMDWCDEKIRRARKNHTEAGPKYKKIFTFLEELSDEAWLDITQKTQFDHK